MSKAFTSEETQAEAPRGRAPPRARELRPITAAGRLALEGQLAQTRRELEWLGQDSRMNELERRARRDELLRREELLAATLATVQEVAPPSDLSRAAFGCTVEVEDGRGLRARYQLVGPDETDARAGRLSAASPLGRALLDQRVGDEVELERPAGPSRLRIVSIS